MTYEISSARTTVEMSRFLFIYLTNETSIIMLVGQHYMCTDMKLIVQHTYLRSVAQIVGLILLLCLVRLELWTFEYYLVLSCTRLSQYSNYHWAINPFV